ncbi:inorganic diphosphatase [Hyphomicrobium sp.]|uniref:inorganic diphosphatase n=1 Tax=Hyphomicrobium sp. TaxID=82 RepID=UPI0025C69B32|nr:inorganic diphosphatase [Hyphomicrobium sp.]MCC7252842.1 inorganic diphosphatase [Hyphomicrobium sp.]
MPNFSHVEPFDAKGRVQMVVETPRGSTIKFKLDEEKGIFTVSRSLTAGLSYPFDWGFVPGTLSEDGDAVDALCLHRATSFPGAVLPCRCLALVAVDQQSSKGRVSNPRLILAPAWEGGDTLEIDGTLSDRAKSELEAFFLNATLFTDKDARIVGWHDAAAAESYVRKARL